VGLQVGMGLHVVFEDVEGFAVPKFRPCE
jgi:hypothetical protein